jgi:hypothetical protein
MRTSLITSRFRGTSRVLTILAVVLVLGIAVLSLPKRHAYRGHTVRYWSKVLWASTRAEEIAAAEAIRGLGTNAVPELAQMLLTKHSRLRAEVMELFSHQSLFPWPFLDGEVDQQRIALKAAYVLGDSARPLVPTLHQVLRDWTNYSADIVFGAIDIAERFAPETTPHLVTDVIPPRMVYPSTVTNKPWTNSWTMKQRYLTEEPWLFGKTAATNDRGLR